MKKVDLQLLGLCRFSYASAAGSGFSTPTNTYNQDRLRSRYTIFKNLWLPSVQGQTNHDFTAIILIGSGLPPEYKSKLYEDSRKTPQIVIHEEEDGQAHADVCNKVLHCYRKPNCDFVGEFCLDDDDAISLNFVEEVHRNFASIRGLVVDHGRAELSFCRGYAAEIQGNQLRLKEVLMPHWTCGQIIFQQMPSRLTLFNLHHFRFWKKHPCLLLSQIPMFLRGFHGTNDTGNRWERIKEERTLPHSPEIIAILLKMYGINVEASDNGSFQFSH